MTNPQEDKQSQLPNRAAPHNYRLHMSRVMLRAT
jgi:hypothetical protein